MIGRKTFINTISSFYSKGNTNTVTYGRDRRKVAGSTSDLHRDENMGYGSRNLTPAGESEMQKLQFTLNPYQLPLTIMQRVNSGTNSCAIQTRLQYHMGPHHKDASDKFSLDSAQ